jgi:uroporphyrinogen-III synthase
MIKVLVTRPLEASRQLARQLEAAGFAAIIMPLYTFSAREPRIDLQSVCRDDGKRKLAVFTSPRAVEFGLRHLPEQHLDSFEFAVVGAATRARLEDTGQQVHIQAGSGFTSEDLLREPALAANPGEALLFCAPGGRQALADGLLELGWKVTQAMVYERVDLRPEAEQVEAIMAARDLLSVWTSVSALKLAKKHLPDDAWNQILHAPALVISTRIQHYLRQLGASRVELAEGPGNPELLSSILRLTGS